jgi:hypothetical protein
MQKQDCLCPKPKPNNPVVCLHHTKKYDGRVFSAVRIVSLHVVACVLVGCVSESALCAATRAAHARALRTTPGVTFARKTHQTTTTRRH